MHDRLFETHGVEWGGVPKRDRAVMIEFAGYLGLDIAVFEKCLDDPGVAEAVRRQTNEAFAVGITSTPSFLINGRLLVGAHPFETFQQAIEMIRGEQ
ncbi:MAG: hypothetical protein KatS3mg057_0574 [Herpetosiphonaceae bacterium]|nr:MAG: hypothetical protein KatS3mg057_0574 [Herpetosiphonaceae bacterium]